MSDPGEALEITDEVIRVYQETLRPCGCGRLSGDLTEERRCSAGNCIELWCPCGVPRGMSWGPCDCPCQNEETP